MKSSNFIEIISDRNCFTESVQESTNDTTPSPLIIIVISVITLVLLIILVLGIVKWRQRWSRPNHRFKRKSIHRRHTSGLDCCQQWCYKSHEESTFQKTNFNGFDVGMYEDAIITTDNTSRPVTKRTSMITSSGGGNGNGDFMSNLTPQWPEPEEATLEQQESFPFIRTHHQHSTFDPGQRRRKNSNESISSSWSSLFNVPGTSSGTGTVHRPNSVAVSNLSSSGSAADYAAKVAFIGNKYRNNVNS